MYPKMFSSDFIFKQQENLVDNQKCQAEFSNYATKYYCSFGDMIIMSAPSDYFLPLT